MRHYNTTVENRMATDVFHPLASGALRLKGYEDQLARFVEKEQLLRDDLWEVFIEQFTFPSDDPNLGWRGEYWGKMMRGGCLTYRYTHSDTLYRTLTKAALGMLEAQDSLGRFSTYSVEKEFDAWDLWCRKYILLGFEYYIDICKNEKLRRKILHAICRHADYILQFIGPKGRDIRTCTRNWGGLNSCSILEPYVRLYNLTGKKRYFDFAKYIVDTGFCSDANIIRLAEQGIPPYRYPVTKAYEMMSCFEGLLEFYRVTGEKYCLDVTERFARMIGETDVTVIGCCGCTHELFDHSAECQTEYREVIMQETCVTVTWMKLCLQLLFLTGKKCYADFLEQSALNAMPGSVNDAGNKSNEGIVFDSYSPLYHNTRGRGVGGYQIFAGEHKANFYGCCACIGSAGTALSCLAGVMTEQEGVAVLFYRKGTALFRTPGGQDAKIKIDSRLPESGKVVLTFSLPSPERFRLLLRIPDWSKTFSTECSAPFRAEKDGGYEVLISEWRDGETVTVMLDASARVLTLNGKIAVRKAGYVLARDQRLDAYSEPVSIRGGKNGYVRVKSVKAPEFARHAFLVPNGEESPVLMIDYASAGKNWDDQTRCGLTVWMDQK